MRTTNGVARDSRRRGSENQEFSAPTMSAPATPYVSPPRQTSPLFSICAIKSGLHLTCPFTPTTSLPSAPTTPPSIAHAGPSTNMEAVDDRFFIYLEYVHPGSINKYIQDHCGCTMTESVVRSFTRHILSGLAYLHSKKTVHRDIKGANLLVVLSSLLTSAWLNIIQMLTKQLTGQRADLSLKGSPYWMAPELMQAVMQRDCNPDLAFAVDIWSLGCTIIEMFTGKPPWCEFEGAAAMFKVMRDSPPVPETMSAEGKDFLRLCFQRNPAERPTASMLLEHRFLKNSSVLSTSPRNSDVSNCSQLFNGMNITEPNSRREKPNFKLDQVPRARNVTSSERYWQQQQQQQHRSPDVIGTVTRLSPRSTLEAIRSPSPSQQPKAKH
ncbi:hypothetical protein Bca52824_055865 [Brassica carinata]|uniref:Protein kinase domain-containing protein n=1 Tax=Brassica carinata TaxID=52824 RepID=A0A8X7RA90_BRACI|nr:hypothetical protein Bca52824_055865 [Brassica carinata]